MAVNNIIPFCPTDTGTNLLSQGDYAVAPDRTIGNQPGVASSKLVNKAMRQSAFISSQVAQYVADKSGSDVLDDGNTTKLLAQMNAALLPLAPVFTKYTTGSGNHNATYIFFIASGNATAAATYTNNGVTYTVKDTVASGLQISMTGNGAPTVSGTLTKASGTGDATLTFYAVRAPLYLKVKLVGPGGGGSGSSTQAANNYGAGGNGSAATTFGTSLLSGGAGAGGGGPGSGAGGAGGTASITAPAVGYSANGGTGSDVVTFTTAPVNGSVGAVSPFGGAGKAGVYTTGPGGAAVANTGSGGGGAGGPANGSAGSSGGAGGYVEATLFNPLSVYAYVVGSAGSAGAAGSSGAAGGAGAAGVILVEEHYQ